MALSVCVVLLTIGLLTHQAETLTIDTQYTQSEINAMVDFTQNINSLSIMHRSIYNDNWFPLQDGDVLEENQLLKFSLGYHLVPGTLQNTSCIKYQLPGNLRISERQFGDVKNSANQDVGDFLITESGLIIIEFNDEFVQKNRSGEPINGDVSFDSDVHHLDTDDEGYSELDFNNNVKIEVATKEPNADKSQLALSKSATNIDYETNTITWEIKIESAKGTTEDVDITDTMENIHVDANTQFVLKDKNGQTVSLSSVNFVQTGHSFTMTVPQMAAGDKYTLTYTTNLDVDNPTTVVNVKNGVKGTSKNDRDKDISDEPQVPVVPFDKKILRKSGTVVDTDGDNKGDKINWTINVNPKQVDISGWTLTDEMLDLPSNLTATITPAINGSSTITFPFTFPQGCNMAYQITYQTDFAQTPGHNETYNPIAIFNPQNEKMDEDNPSVWGPDQYRPLQKSVQGTQDVQGGTAETGNVLINWHVDFNSDLGTIKSPTTIKDQLNVFGNHIHSNSELEWYTESQKQAIESAFATAIQGKMPSNSYTFNWTKYDGYNDRYQKYEIVFNQEIPRNTHFSFDYQSTAFDDGLDKYQFGNSITINDSWTSSAQDDKTPTMPFVRKYDIKNKFQTDLDQKTQDTQNNPGDQNDKKNDGIMSWGIELFVPADYDDELVLNEFLPDGVVFSTDNKKDSNPPRIVLSADGFNAIDFHPVISDDGKSYELNEIKHLSNEQSRGTITATKSNENKVKVDDNGVAILDQNKQMQIEQVNAPCVKFVFDESTVRDLAGKKVYIEFNVKFTDDAQFEENPNDPTTEIRAFRNTVQMNCPSDEYKAGDTHTQTIVKDKTDDIFVKSHDQTVLGHESTEGQEKYTDNEIPFTLEINPLGKDVDPLHDQIEINDTISFDEFYKKNTCQITLKSNSVSFVRVDEHGNETPLSKDEYNAVLTKVELSQGPGTEHDGYKITATVPDETHIIMRYTYVVSGPINETLTIRNSATSGGVTTHPHETQDTLVLKIQQAQAHADIAGVIIRKVDADDWMKGLDGAVFAIWGWDATQNKYLPVPVQKMDVDPMKKPHRVPGAESPTGDVGDDDEEFLIDGNTFETGTNGDFPIELTYNRAYKIIEIKAPNGYRLDTTPFYFTIDSTDLSLFPNQMPTDFNGKHMQSGAVIYYPNVKKDVTVGVEKYWFNGLGEKIKDTTNMPEITVELYRIATPYDGADEEESTEETTTQQPVDHNFYVKLFSTYVSQSPGEGLKNMTGDYYDECDRYTSGTTGSITYRLYGTNQWSCPQDLTELTLYNEANPWGMRIWTNPTCKSTEPNEDGLYEWEYRYTFTITDDSILRGNRFDDNWQSILVPDSFVVDLGDLYDPAQETTTEPPTEPETDVIEQPDTREHELVEEIVLNKDNAWQYNWYELPRISEDGNFKYTYYVREITPDGYRVEYTNNDRKDGIYGGVISISNYPRETESHTGGTMILPNTGGNGIVFGYVAGFVMLMIAMCAAIIHIKRKQHEE